MVRMAVKSLKRVWLGNLKESTHLEDVNIDGMNLSVSG